jgi:hypothetical protein
MMAKRTERRARLSDLQQQQLRASIRAFVTWLSDRVRVALADEYRLEFARPTSADWLMRVANQGNETVVTFNPSIIAQCSYRYYEMVVLHEVFHLFVQNIPNKIDAKRVKDDFGDVTMKLLDIEADYFTAMFLVDHQGATLVDILKLFYEGSRVFADPDVRITKLERFIGSILSISAPHLDPRWRSTDSNLYLPTIGNIPTEESIHILVLGNTNCRLSTIRASYQDFYDMKLCFTMAEEKSVRGYVSQLIRFACKALDCEMPPRIVRNLDELDEARPLFSLEKPVVKIDERRQSKVLTGRRIEDRSSRTRPRRDDR